MSILTRSGPTVHSNPPPDPTESPYDAPFRAECDDFTAFMAESAMDAAWLSDQLAAAELPTADDAPGAPEDLTDLADWLDAESAALLPRNDPRAHWLSDQLADLAGKARYLSARTPDEFDRRDHDNHLELRAIRYDQGVADGRSGGFCHHCGC